MFAQCAFLTTAAWVIELGVPYELGDVKASRVTGSRRFRGTAAGTGGAGQSVSLNLGEAYALFSSPRPYVHF